METLRCPTCVALLPDPEARRCPLCHSKLRKKRKGSGAIVLGESGRRSGRSLPSEVEFHVSRAEERILPDEKRLDEIVHDPANVPHAPEPLVPTAWKLAAASEPIAPMAPVAAAKSETVEAVLAFAPTEPAPIETPLVEPVVAASAPGIDLSAEAEPEVLDIAAEELAEPEVAAKEAIADEPVGGRVSVSSDSRPKSTWQAVTARNATPLDGSLNDMVGELHRKAREDAENHGSR
jgi:hypothetical protein